MYSSIFIESQGSNIFTLLGALDSIKERLRETVYYNIIGNASLILLLKFNGYTFSQSYDKLKDFPLINSMINGYSLFPEDQEEKKLYLRNWIIKVFREKNIFNEETKLKDIHNLTKIFPIFILWDRESRNIININPKTHPETLFIDCLMASLTSLGLYNTYSFENYKISNIYAIEVFPVHKAVIDNLSRALICCSLYNYSPKLNSGVLGPMAHLEDEILLQGCERKDYFSKIILNNLATNKLKLYSYLIRGDSNQEERNSHFKSGQRQGNAFINGQDTELSALTYQDMIINQP